jgi:hypothetical protein
MAQEQPAMVVILTCGYCAKCVAGGCANVARAILRYADAGGISYVAPFIVSPSSG